MKKNNIQMIILCGGRGKRMGSITKRIPKPMIKVGNRPILEHKLKFYRSQKIENFIFCLGYKAKIIKNFLKRKKIRSTCHNAGVNTGILKRIFLVRELIKRETLISYGDTWAQIDFNALLSSHKRSKCTLTLVAAPIKNPFGLLNWDNKKKAIFFNEKPILNHFIGYAVINPNIFKKLNKKIINMQNGKGMVEAIKHLIKKKEVNIYTFNNLQVTINSPEELKNAKLNYKKYFTLNEKTKK
jgi:glucose-1-phosphate cytidylyltransferase